MARRNAIADGFNALAAAAKAIQGLRAPAADVARANTFRAIWSDLRAFRVHFQRIEESFKAISEFASRTSAILADLNRRMMELETRRLSAGDGEHDR